MKGGRGGGGWNGCVNRVSDFWLPLKKYRKFDRDVNVSLSSGYYRHNSFSISTSLYLARAVVLSKHHTYYGSMSGFQHCNMKIPIEKAPTTLHPACGEHN